MEQRTVAHVEPRRQHRRDELGRRLHPADAQAGGDDLGERSGSDDPVPAGDGAQRRKPFVAEVELGVGGVLQDQDAVLRRQPDEVCASRHRHVEAGGVLERRDRVDELDRPPLPAKPGNRGLQIVEADPLVVHVDADDLGLVPAHRAERAAEGRDLADDDVARIEEGGADEIDRAGSAVREHEVVGTGNRVLVPGEVAGDLFAQGLVAAGTAVDERGVVRRVEGAPHGLEEGVSGLGGGVGDAARERDRRPLGFAAAPAKAPVGGAPGGEAADVGARVPREVAVAPELGGAHGRFVDCMLTRGDGLEGGHGRESTTLPVKFPSDGRLAPDRQRGSNSRGREARIGPRARGLVVSSRWWAILDSNQ